jgi:acyl-CoA synthetase (NDP forming)
MTGSDREAMASSGSIPTHVQPEDAARALGRVMRHVNWRARPAEEATAPPGIRPDEATALLASALGRSEEWLGAKDAARLLDCYGIETPQWRIATDAAAASHAAEEIGGRIALKAIGPEILHKSDIGAVRTGLADATAVAGAAVQMDESLESAGVEREGFLVQAMAQSGVELLVGIVNDAAFGPVLACGAGGTRAELHRDMVVRICPLNADDPDEMLRALEIYPLLTGFRGEPPVDLAGLEELLLRVSAMVDSHPEILEMDLNPVIAGPEGAVAVDARIRIRPAVPARPWPSTWKPIDS